MSARAPLGKTRKDDSRHGSNEEYARLREVEQLWAALWLSAELRDVIEHSSRLDTGDRA